MSSKIPQRLRYKIFAVMDDCDAILPIIYQLISYRQFEPMLNYLLANRLFGKAFLDWFKACHNNSVMGMAQDIIMKLEKNRRIRPVLVNKDYLVG